MIFLHLKAILVQKLVNASKRIFNTPKICIFVVYLGLIECELKLKFIIVYFC